MSAIHRTARWANFTSRVRPIIQAALPLPCVDPAPGCPGLVQPTDKWDTAHLVAHVHDPFQALTLENVGPAHRSCNRKNGGKLGKAKQMATKRQDQRLPAEGSGW